MLLIAGALVCFGGSLISVYVRSPATQPDRHSLWARSSDLQVAVTHDPNRKEDRTALKRGEYLAGGSVVEASVIDVIVTWHQDASCRCLPWQFRLVRWS